ncbi:Di-heme Cytochrome c peroxidase [Sulfitobacter noctilucicola]|uniref:Cytochrome c peroxidase n=1 Tax=Sulfitobacter noctilucicola TaxID=1342301 RepID=A0A7W6M9W1_9RHOB|nr:cytochrome c peroxidase [Sulfitobacter noctilucicola]KIN63768.1 Di-heme Cytochrome c peroxidase [Sulfitobacter noctilucicola]MBB4174723.1 cytochrome c peroxidase [Sulfitobacter noctilucicola]
MRHALIFALLALVPATGWTQTLPAPVHDDMFAPVPYEEAVLGQLLFYDPILSGNKNIACATCHHPSLATADGVALAIGEGGVGLGPERQVDPATPPDERIPRNAPALFNLAANEFTVLFHDGRLELDDSQPGGIRTPMDADMLTGFASLLSAQTMFPVLSAAEMAGGYRENEVGRAVRQGLISGPGGAWDLIARRVAEIPEYADRFISFYPHIHAAEDIAFTDISNAIAVFMGYEWRSDTSRFDAVLRGQEKLSGAEAQGLRLFYGNAGCASCHSGPFLTDHKFHAMGAPQIGPGKATSFQNHHRDEGRFLVTGDPGDMYAFRTPSLRNVALTAPYGHAGAHADLAEFLAAHADPAGSIKTFDPTTVRLPQFVSNDFDVMEDAAQVEAISKAVTAPTVALQAKEIAAITAFLETLTDSAAVEGRLGIPATVPSGLPVP